MNDVNTVSIQDKIGKGYADFWNFKGAYRVCKGSRASKKSKNTSIYYIVKLMQYPLANLLVIRKTFRTLQDSCFADLKWAVNRLGVEKYWKARTNPLELEYIPTGQKILFRGLDDPLKVTSISVEKGVLCWCWIEEAYEVMNESDFDMLDESIRGTVPDGYFKQITLTFNPWNERHWIKHRFFDVKDDPDILATTKDYRCNEWLDEADKRKFERMKKNNPRRYQVAGLGNWGVVDGLVFENWEEAEFNFKEIAKRENVKSAFGLDFGYTNDPTAFFCGLIDTENKIIYVFDELYQKGLVNREIYEKIESMGYAKEKITADSAEPKSIAELNGFGLTHCTAAKKGKDSIMNGIQFIQDCHIVVHPQCVNFITEISNYTWATDKFGNKQNKPIDDFNHLMDAMRYALEKYIKTNNNWIY